MRTKAEQAAATRRAYWTDLSDDQWAIFEPILRERIPPPRRSGRQRSVSLREVMNTLLYQQRTGCQWSLLPHDLLPKSTVYDDYKRWIDDGTWQHLMDTLREQARVQCGPSPVSRDYASLWGVWVV